MIINHPSSHHQLKAWQAGGVHVRTFGNFVEQRFRPPVLKRSSPSTDTLKTV
jgi:hypothetical protein